MTYYCWRCSRRLDIVAAPVEETVTVLCQRCKARNVVQQGFDPSAEVSDALDRLPRTMIKSRLTTL